MAVTFSEVWTQIKNAIALLDSARTEATSQLTLLDTYKQSLEGTFASSAGAAAWRAACDSWLRTAQQIITPHLQDLAEVIGSDAAVGSRDFWYDLSEYMHANSETLNSRDIVYGTVAGSTGTGNVTIERLTVDWNGYDLESLDLGTVTAECKSDQLSGETKWREPLELSMDTPAPDWLEDGGLGTVETLYGNCGDDGLLSNASFQTIDLSGGSIQGWTADVTINATNFTELSEGHRTSPEERASATGTDAPKALRVNASATLTQKLRYKGSSVDYDVPVWAGLAWRPSATAAGSLVLHLGGTSKTLATFGGAETYQWYYGGLDMGTGLWPVNWQEDDPSVRIALTLTAGTVDIDDVIAAEMTWYNGLPYICHPANAGGVSQVAPLRGYKRTFATSTAGDAKIMRLLHLIYGRDWPSNWGVSLPTVTGGTETITDP